MNVTMKQKEILLNYLKRNPELVRGRIDRKNKSRLKLSKLWDEVAQGINTIIEGPQKTGKEWAKTWKDMKSYILKKEAKRRNYVQGTGGGPPPKVAFSVFEEQVLELLTPEAAGLENIPEGGINTEENPISESIEVVENTETTEQDIYMMTEEDNRNQENTIENIENIPLYNDTEKRERRKVYTSLNRKNTIRGNSIQTMSFDMLKIQERKLKLKKKEIKLKKKELQQQKNILCELIEIKTALKSWSENDTLI